MIYKEKLRINMETEPKVDCFLGIKRPNRDPPVIKPRSRSLDDLPGCIRVPVLKRPEPRLKPRLEATVAGLQELKVLREKHEKLFKDATGRVSANSVDPVETHETSQPTLLRSMREHSSSSLGKITEEDGVEEITDGDSTGVPIVSENNSQPDDPALHQVRSRRPLSFSDSSFLENELNEHGSLGKQKSRAKHQPFRDEGSNTFSTSSLQNSPKNSLLRSESVPIYSGRKKTNTQSKISQIISATKPNVLGRSKSLSFTAINSARLPTNSTTFKPVNKEVEPKLRRASLQCEQVLTKHKPFIPMSKFLSDLKLSCNSPGPLHAVLMQYGSQSVSDDTVQGESRISKPAPKTVHVRRALFRLGKDSTIDMDSDSADTLLKTNVISRDTNLKKNKNINESALPVANGTVNTENKHNHQPDESRVQIPSKKSLPYNKSESLCKIEECPESVRSQGNTLKCTPKTETSDCKINNNSNSCDNNIENNQTNNDAVEENDDSVFMCDQNNSFASLGFRVQDFGQQRSNKWKKTLSLASDEGYVPSLSDTPREHSRLSIRSESSWMSSEFDDTTSTVDSGVAVPVSYGRTRVFRSSFASSSVSMLDDVISSMSDSGLDLLSPSVKKSEASLRIVPTSSPRHSDREQMLEDLNTPESNCQNQRNEKSREKSILKPLLETSL